MCVGPASAGLIHLVTPRDGRYYIFEIVGSGDEVE